MPTPNWAPAVTGAQATAGQVDQFLGTHGITYIYEGASVGGMTDFSIGSQNIDTTTPYLYQKFVLTGTSIQRVWCRLAAGGAGADLTIGLYNDSAGNPSTLVTAKTVPLEWCIGSGAGADINAFVSVPFQRGGLTNGATYHWVFSSSTATGTDFPGVYLGASVGFVARTASVFPGGPWTNSVGHSVTIQWFNSTTVGRLVNTVEDSSARITGINYDLNTGADTVTRVYEYTASVRQWRVVNLSTGGILTSVV